MKILLDENSPQLVRLHLPGHDVSTVQYNGWNGKKNGELIALAVEAGFDVLLTFDQSISYQQNLTGVSLAIVVIVVPNRRIETILPILPKVLACLLTIEPGHLVRIE